MGRPRKLTPEQEIDVQTRAVKLGQPYYALAVEYKVDEGTIRNCVRRVMGKKYLRPARICDPRIVARNEKMYQLWQEGKTFKAIGEMFNMTGNGARGICRRMQIKKEKEDV